MDIHNVLDYGYPKKQISGTRYPTPISCRISDSTLIPRRKNTGYQLIKQNIWRISHISKSIHLHTKWINAGYRPIIAEDINDITYSQGSTSAYQVDKILDINTYRVTHSFLTPSFFRQYKELTSYWFSIQVKSHCGYSICRQLWDNLKTLKYCQCWILWTLKATGCKEIMDHPVCT